MSDNARRTVRVAILDLYNGEPNQGMRCIRQQVSEAKDRHPDVRFDVAEFDVRGAAEVPGLDFDLYISSGGPGSPFDGAGQVWEERYFAWLDAVWTHNRTGSPKKHVLSICHSFQLMCIHFGLADVVPRKSGSFGVLPVHLTDEGQADPLLSKLPDPFYGADFREWQVLQPRYESIQSLGASLLAIEKDRPHVPLERAVMAMRVSPEIVGTQFHPEADPEGMRAHFSKDEQRDKIVSKHGQEKYDEILFRMSDPDSLSRTYAIFIPEFIRQALSGPN
jgi:GMP synthase-like glutamine amidotransferase